MRVKPKRSLLESASGLVSRDLRSDRHNLAVDPETPIALDAYDAVIVGAPIHDSHDDAWLADYLLDAVTPLLGHPAPRPSRRVGVRL